MDIKRKLRSVDLFRARSESVEFIVANILVLTGGLMFQNYSIVGVLLILLGFFFDLRVFATYSKNLSEAQLAIGEAETGLEKGKEDFKELLDSLYQFGKVPQGSWGKIQERLEKIENMLSINYGVRDSIVERIEKLEQDAERLTNRQRGY